MQLALDIGNSNVVAGLYEDGAWKVIQRFPTQVGESPIVFYQVRLADFLLENSVRVDDVRQVILSSVVPALTGVFQAISETFLQREPLLIGPAVYPVLKLKIRNPYEIGADLVANAAAACELYGKDCIVVDFGTALTFTTVTAQGEILGVAIAPGIKTAISALFQKTAQLPPEVPLQLPATPVGKDTVHAIQSGVLLGYEGLVRHLIATIRQEVGAHYITVATGGLSSVLVNLEQEFDEVNRQLTLDGLIVIAKTVGHE